MSETKIRYTDMDKEQKKEYHRMKAAERRSKQEPKPKKPEKVRVYKNLSPEDKKKYHHKHYLAWREKCYTTNNLISILEGRGYEVTPVGRPA